MSNTYFEINKKVITSGFGELDGYTNEYNLTLTAFMGGENTVQLTVQSQSTNKSMNGVGFIVLSDSDIDKLVGALMERKAGLISATGSEQSKFSPPSE